MLPPRLDIRGVSPTSAASAAQAVATPRQEAFQRALSQMVGQTLPAQVLSKFNDGSFLVRVADTNARMLLPPGVNTGDELPLTVISAQPRPTLQVGAGSPQAGQMATFVSGDPIPDTPAGGGRLPAQEAAIINLSGKQPPAGQAGQAAGGAAAGAPGAALNAGAGAAVASGAAAAAAGRGAEGDAVLASQTSAPQTQARPLSPGAALLSKAPLVPADQLPALGKDTPQAALSPAARAIASALASAYTSPGVPVTINGKAPLSAGGPPDTAKLSEGLQRALGDSGLFYESHVAEWAAGKRPLQDLQREPQMQRHAALQGANQNPLEAAAKLAAGPDLSAAQMINQQLHTQEQGKVLWQGEAWPGQQMQWLVEREQQRQGGQGGRDGRDGEADTVWRSGVRFRFPLLGTVGAKVTLVGDQVHIAVESGSEETADTLRAWAGALQQALDAAGAPLASLAIKAEGHDGPG
ncbi:flagellar hook-length control protein FliK [Pseudoduganella sp. DS3]|uniref:Flagellar hook-length control protein FliK n=1 Tax=Pseudoduganella guangdongensis TaxID=2692179 RepID=A0A6N9HED8_9BURK|nr:flagellar hook-length control protein FliK [Pseudoduganella guangdongensis]MYN01884.1 flagellar hook-length control protein FliK [Pseudoduganella guangdongensis]